MTVAATDLLLEARRSRRPTAPLSRCGRRHCRPTRRGPRTDGRERRRQEHSRQDPDGRRPAGQAADRRSWSRARAYSPARPVATASSRCTRSRSLIPDLDMRSNLRLTGDAARAIPPLAAELGSQRICRGWRAEHPAGLTTGRRSCSRARDRARRSHARRDDRGPAGRPDGACARGHRACASEAATAPSSSSPTE